MGEFVAESAKLLFCPVIDIELDFDEVVRDPARLAGSHDLLVTLDYGNVEFAALEDETL